MGAIHTPPLSLLPWALPAHKVPSGQFSSPIKLSISGDYYPSELPLPCFHQSVRRPSLEQIPSQHPLLPSCWARWGRERGWWAGILAQQLRAIFEQIPLGCGRPFLASIGLFTQPHSDRLETIWVMVSHGPTLVPSPGITQLPNLSGT